MLLTEYKQKRAFVGDIKKSVSGNYLKLDEKYP